MGVLGFSQGCRVAAGLLLEQMSGKGVGEGDGLAFAVFANGTCPPLAWELSEAERGRLIDCPTLHVIGLQDPHREGGRMLYGSHCEKQKAALLEFEVGHRFPTAEEDTEEVVAEILRMYRETSGKVLEVSEAQA